MTIFNIMLGKSHEKTILYNQIEAFELIYQKKIRVSPFDINPDYLFVRLSLADHQLVLPVSSEFVKSLPQGISYIQKRGIKVSDKANIIQAIINGEHLYKYMNQSTRR